MKRIIIVGWLLCSFISYGTWFGYFQGKYPTLAKENYRQDMGSGLLVALILPPTAIIYPFLSGFWEYGFKIY